MARIKSSWWKPSPLRYVPPIVEVRRQEQEYRKWLAETRRWSKEKVDAYLRPLQDGKLEE